MSYISTAGAGGGAPTGSAGGDLGGTYPNPTVVSIADVTTGNLKPANFVDPSAYIYFFDDFIGWGTAAPVAASGVVIAQQNTLAAGGALGTSWVSLAAGTPNIIGQVTWDSGSYGVAQITSGATSGNYASIMGGGGNATFFLNTASWEINIRAKMTSTASTSVLFGFASGSGLESAATDYIGIGFDTSQGDAANWMAVTRSATGTPTRTIVAGTLDTAFHNFRIWSTVNGTINFTVDGGATTSFSTTVPTVALVPLVASGTRTSASKVIRVDYYKFWQTVSR